MRSQTAGGPHGSFGRVKTSAFRVGRVTEYSSHFSHWVGAGLSGSVRADTLMRMGPCVDCRPVRSVSVGIIRLALSVWLIAKRKACVSRAALLQLERGHLGFQRYGGNQDDYDQGNQRFNQCESLVHGGASFKTLFCHKNAQGTQNKRIRYKSMILWLPYL